MKRTRSLERYFYALDYEKKIKSKLTKKQFAAYTFLLSISKWDAQSQEQHYYVYKNSFTAKEAGERCKISQPTWRKALEVLQELSFIKDNGDFYTIPFPREYSPLNIKLISTLLDFSIAIDDSGNLAGVYSTLYKYWNNCYNNNCKCCITIASLVALFGGKRELKSYKYYEILLHLFNSTGLMTIKFNKKKYCGNIYTEYEIVFVNNQLPSSLDNQCYGADDIKDILEAIENSI